MLKINLKFFFVDKYYKLTNEKILSYKVNTISYRTLRILFEEIFFKNEYFFQTSNVYPVIFDCGSNIGFATLYFKMLYPHSKIYCFEPEPIAFNVLKSNIEKNNLEDILLFNKAISNKQEEIAFHIDPSHPSSLSMSIHSERESVNSIIVESIRLSDIIQENKIDKIDFLKLDVEGSEWAVLEDLIENDILNRIDNMCIEYHHKINLNVSELGKFLLQIENSGFQYQIYSDKKHRSFENQFQDVIIYCYR